MLNLQGFEYIWKGKHSSMLPIGMLLSVIPTLIRRHGHGMKERRAPTFPARDPEFPRYTAGLNGRHGHQPSRISEHC